MGRGAGNLPLYYEGEWDATVPYLPRQVVTHAGHPYMALASSTGVTPGSDPTVWLLLGGGGLYVSTLAGGPPTDGSVFWYVTDETC